MNFTDNFLNEFRKVIKEILLEGDLERLNLAKQFLGFDNKVFGDFLAPLLKEEQELVIHHNLAYSDTPQNLVVVSSEDHNSLSHGEFPSSEFLDNVEYSEVALSSDELPTQTSEPTYKWCPRTFSQDARGSLCGIALLTERGFEIEDVETGEVLYDNNFEVYKRFDLSHGLVISFNLSGPRIYDISYEKILEPKTGFTYVENCPLNKDEEGYYVPSDSEGKSLREYGSRCGVFNLNDYLVKTYRLATAHSVDLVIKEGEIPRIAWVHKDNQIKPTSSSSSAVSSNSNRTLAKYDFDLKGKKVAIIGLPKSQVERFNSLVLDEKKAEALEVIDSSSHNDTELAPDKLKDFDIVIVVKRFVGHGTIYCLKTLLEGSQAQLISSSSHLYRGVKGYPSEEGATIVDYPLL